MKKKDYDNYEPPTDYSQPSWSKDRSRPSRDSGKRQRHLQQGRSLDSLIPCDQCMALFGTNSNCDTCQMEGQTNLAKFRSTPELAHLLVHKQPKLNGFICPLLTSKGAKCIAFEDSVGKGVKVVLKDFSREEVWQLQG